MRKGEILLIKCQKKRSLRLWRRREKIEEEIKDQEGILTNLQRSCDHTLPDGTSAAKSFDFFGYASCSICGKII